ncbi:MAG: hypothetical protein GYA22_04120, partial [Bacteroidales bacterium]|nr:hypothetical protein [Bacteroidales bacterium]
MNKHCSFCDHNRLVWGLASGGILIVLLIVAALIFHKPIENTIFTRKIASVEHRIHGRIIIRKAEFEGLKKMNFYGIQVLCSDSSSFVTIDSVKVKIALLPALTGHLKLRDLYVSGLNLRLVKNDKRWNFQLLAAHEPQVQSSSEPAKP